MSLPAQSNVERSYELHREGERRHRESGQLPSFNVDPGSVDSWRHERMKDFLDPLLSACPGSTWLTVGDGRYGSDAQSLIRKGQDVTASSLTDETLSVAHAEGWINSYAAENAEAISCADGAFDFVLCKESYHHFPRPPLALYEMLRVARQGVVLIEPIESGRTRPLDWGRMTVKRALRGDSTSLYEPGGNFLYRADPRSLQKLLAAMGLRHLAVMRFNDFYMPQLKLARARWSSPGFAATRLGIGLQGLLCKARLMNWGLGVVVLFSAPPAPETLAALTAAGFEVVETPENPYQAENS